MTNDSRPSKTTIFSATGLTKTYLSGEVGVHALRALNLDIFGGEVVVL